jgi:hypothetical protein
MFSTESTFSYSSGFLKESEPNKEGFFVRLEVLWVMPPSVAYPGIFSEGLRQEFFRGWGGGSTNSVEDRGQSERRSGGR